MDRRDPVGKKRKGQKNKKNDLHTFILVERLKEMR
jgi:hypothetical protein